MDKPERHAHRGPKAPPRPPLPPEIPIYGPSPAAVRAVAEGLLRALPPDLRVALVEGPSPMAEAPGLARLVRVDAPAWDARERRAALADCDLILALGRPSPDRPGILALDGDGIGNLEVTDAQTAGAGGGGKSDLEATGVPPAVPDPGNAGGPAPALLACVAAARPAGLPPGIPVFPPGRPEPLAALLLGRLRSAAAPLYGLVLGGGRSERMGTDKAALAYHGQPQTRRGLELLAPFCAQAFVSCRAEQSHEPAFAGLPQIHDTFLGLGPMGGILSALRAHPGAAFLVIACDLPFLDAATLEALAKGRDPLRAATAFAGPQDGLPEPLCAIYEPRAYARALQLVGQGVDCPRKFILNSSSVLLTPPDLRALRNVNDPGGYREALASL
jgi:molybdopterin-guanine dinucleotide biosynthesis protein A